MGCFSSNSKNKSKLSSNSETINFIFTETNKPNAKTIKILSNFDNIVNKIIPNKKIQKLLKLIREKGYNTNYGWQPNKPGDRHSICLFLSLDEKNENKFVIYSNFGHSSSLETIHGDIEVNIIPIADLIIGKFEENENLYLKEIINNEKENNIEIPQNLEIVQM